MQLRGKIFIAEKISRIEHETFLKLIVVCVYEFLRKSILKCSKREKVNAETNLSTVEFRKILMKIIK